MLGPARTPLHDFFEYGARNVNDAIWCSNSRRPMRANVISALESRTTVTRYGGWRRAGSGRLARDPQVRSHTTASGIREERRQVPQRQAQQFGSARAGDAPSPNKVEHDRDLGVAPRLLLGPEEFDQLWGQLDREGLHGDRKSTTRDRSAGCSGSAGR